MTKERIAVWALRKDAVAMARACAGAVDAQAVFVPQDAAEDGSENRMVGYDAFGKAVSNHFREFTAHVFVMAVGIVVRHIAGMLKDKTTDPAVVVVDERGRHAVSLVSGHLGGANALARRLADAIGADPVVTTATDLHGIQAMDEMARGIGAKVENKEMIKTVSGCMLEGKPTALVCDSDLFETFYGNAETPPDHFETIVDVPLDGYDAVGIVSEKLIELPEGVRNKCLLIRPPVLVAGIGCNKNTSAEEIAEAVSAVCDAEKLSALSIAGLGTIDVKKTEPGLAAYAEAMGIRLVGYTAEALNAVDAPGMSAPSPAAEKHVGAKGVAEPAAILGAGPDARLLVAKKKIGNVTVALAVKRMDGVASGKGRLFVVGIGPGGLAFITPHARRALEKSDVVAGYTAYINLIAPLIGEKQVISTGMTKETQRVDRAIAAAADGGNVALVCSGDAGIYAMAGLVYERMQAVGVSVETEISPGISAAIAAGSILGAPLTNDFITISLSNLLTPTETVKKRIAMAAASDLVTAVYNPISKKRTELIRRLQAEFSKHRSEDTPVGIVTHALRPGQRVQICTLGDFLEADMNMNSIVIIGNSETVMIGEKMVTRRGYERKK